MELGLAVLPPIVEHTHTVIFLHGRGDTAQDFSEALFWSRDSARRSLKDIFPSVRWVFPQSELRLCEGLGEDWSQWFDIWNMLDFSEQEEMQAPGLRESVLSIRRLVYREASRVGGLDKVVLAGISQGGATAVHSLLHLGVPDDGMLTGELTGANTPPLRLGAFLGFSCWLPFPGGTLEETREVLGLEGSPSDEILRHTPVFLGHCADDAVIFVEYGKQLRNSLYDFDMDVAWKEYPDGGHWINSPRAIDDAVEFLIAQGVPTDQPVEVISDDSMEVD
ncbi:Alpha/Beta hydrolase protein [Whalleya microplaca]|nr:Alpha/Beta hydrolase protein [Whalleya microplaca]